MIKNIQVISFCWLVLVACKAKKIEPKDSNVHNTYQKIGLDYGDSLLYVRLYEEELEKVDFQKYYYWFKRDTVIMSQGAYSGRLLHGDYEVFRQSNKTLIRKGAFDAGLKSGTWMEWYKDGKLRSAYDYKDGEKHGDFLLQNEQGQPIMKGAYAKGKLDGKCTFYHADTLSYEIKYTNGYPKDTLP